MSSPSVPRNKGLRRKFHDSFLRLRSPFRGLSDHPGRHSVKTDLDTDSSPRSHSAVPPQLVSDGPLQTCQVGDANTGLAVQSNLPSIQSCPSAIRASTVNIFDNQSINDVDLEANANQDIWSAAFREAVDSLDTDIDVAILKGRSIGQIMKQLEEMDEDAVQESVFRRGVKYLRSIQVPLEKFKLALDLVNPLAGFDPTAKAVFGVVTGVTAIAISFATADLEFAKQIGEMLSHLEYIDGCDTLGQQTNRVDIHKALVSVYRKILEFYKASFAILSRQGVKLVLKMALEQNRLPDIVQEFLKHADMLQKHVQNATTEILLDVERMLYDQEIVRWLGGDKIGQQSELHADLGERRADKACEFLLQHSKFTQWYHTLNPNVLAVIGNMGTGKSVAAAFLVDELIRRRAFIVPHPMICYHYCRNDETGRTNYVLSVLILSLLQQLTGLKKSFHSWYKENQASGNIEPAKDAKKLGEFFQDMVRSLDRTLFIVIDGLDECDRQSRIRILKLLQASSQENKRIKILLCSRPNEELFEFMDDVGRIDLVSDPHRDRIIVEHTVNMRLTYLMQDVKQLVIDELSRRAEGSAIWTDMAVKLIDERQIRALVPMKRFLERLPLSGQLSLLYEDLLLRHTSNIQENKDLAGAALKLLAVSSRPLSKPELAWAAALATAPPGITTVAALADLVDEQRLLGLIRPFVATLTSDDIKDDRIRLAHQSVKEYVIENLIYQSKESATEKVCGQAFCARKNLHLEAMMLEICIRYLLLDDIDRIDLFSEEQRAIEELPQEVDLFDDDREPIEYNPHCTWEEWEKAMTRYDPAKRGFGEFFVYASCYWLDHFGAVDEECFTSLDNVEILCASGSRRLHNWTQQNSRPGCVVKPRFEFDSTLYDPLGITSLYGSDTMLHHMVRNSNFRSDKFLPNSAVAAANQILRWGDLARLDPLVLDGSNDTLDGQLRGVEFWLLVLDFWNHHDQRSRNWDAVFNLIDDTSDALVEEQSANELLCIAARAGCLPLIQRLMTKAQHDEQLQKSLLITHARTSTLLITRKLRHQSIGEAVLGDHIDVVRFLLQQDGIQDHLTYINPTGENIMHLAALRCNPEMFRLLAPLFQKQMHQAAIQGDSALVRVVLSSAIPYNRFESARILLLNAADSDKYAGIEQQNPLRVAVQIGDLDMCSLLLNVGNVDPRSALVRGCDGQTGLIHETLENADNRSAILQMLSGKVATWTSLPVES